MSNLKTYISLFSSAGVGCYGFKMEGFECIATNEYLKKRLEVQKNNKKCKYDTGYLDGDITLNDTKQKLFNEILFWEKIENVKRVDVLIATPPCQGMSVANHKKKENEIVRNSLVVESIKIINEVNPKFFVFENVPAFMKTICTDVDGVDKTIGEAIKNNLGKKYSYLARIINFKNHGACSSRQRCLVIGVSVDIANEISPYELFPDYVPEKTLRDVIGMLPSLNKFGEIDKNDIYHSFREYQPEQMREWIHDLKEGESAFDNLDINKKPHHIIDGKYVLNKQKNGDKYRRQIWDKVGPCIHTRNDQLASQNTVHPKDDRVFSIRELMLMMTIPKNFQWTNRSLSELNKLPVLEKKSFLKKEEMNIRQCLGEAVPTKIFQSVAKKICNALNSREVNTTQIKKIINDNNLLKIDNLISYIKENPLNLSVANLSHIAELANTKRIDNAAYFTNKPLITEMMKALPNFDGEELYILEPSVGVGNFLPLLVKKYENKMLHIDIVDIDSKCFDIIKALLPYFNLPKTCIINFIHGDFLLTELENKYDLVIGNPPFNKLTSENEKLKMYRQNAFNQLTANTSSFFLEKAMTLGKYTFLIMPKNFLNTPEYVLTRELVSKKTVECIIDFGETGFPGVTVETIAILITATKKKKLTTVFSLCKNIEIVQKQNYIFDNSLPYWIIYRNVFFDNVFRKLHLGVFNVFRDRQLTKNVFCLNGDIRVLKARNIGDDGVSVIDVDGYDVYVKKDDVVGTSVYKYLNSQDVYLTPNMTYYPRVIKKPKGVLVDGSVAILIPKNKFTLTKEQLEFFSTNEYRQFYCIARNYQTRSLNVDACSVYFYGVLRENI